MQSSSPPPHRYCPYGSRLSKVAHCTQWQNCRCTSKLRSVDRGQCRSIHSFSPMILTAGILNRKVYTIHVLPGTIDLEKFKDALSCTLQMYPHVAGWIRCQDGNLSVSSLILWSISLLTVCGRRRHLPFPFHPYSIAILPE